MNKPLTPKERQKVKLDTPTDLGSNATRDISGALNALLADVFALYMKTKNFHWHVSGPHFRSLHLLFDEHGIVAVPGELARSYSYNPYRAEAADLRKAAETAPPVTD